MLSCSALDLLLAHAADHETQHFLRRERQQECFRLLLHAVNIRSGLFEILPHHLPAHRSVLHGLGGEIQHIQHLDAAAAKRFCKAVVFFARMHKIRNILKQLT